MVKFDAAVLPDGGVTRLALNEAVTPDGTPETDRATAELKPFRDVTVMVEVLDPP